MNELSSDAFLPLYARVEMELAANIADGSLPAGAQLPPEDGLIGRFAVRGTRVRTAIQNLARRGLVEIQRGKGTFVTQPKVTQELTELRGFVEDMQALGRSASARLVDRRVVAATEDVARQLGLTTGAQVMRIQRVRLSEGTAMSFDETWLPLEIGEKIVAHDLGAEPIFSLLEERYGIPLVEAEYRLEAVAAEAHVAEALTIGTGSPIFLIERTSCSTG